MLNLIQANRLVRGCALLMTLLLSSVSMAAQDRLQTPSTLTANAANGLLLDIAHAGDRLVVVGDQGVILLSDDQGQTWRQVTTPVSVLLTAVYFVDAKLGWAVGHDGVVLHTQDAGETWQLQLDGHQLNQIQVDQYQALVDGAGDPIDNEILLEDRELMLDDATVAAEEGPTQPFLDVMFFDDQHGLIVGAYGLVVKTEDAGKTWHMLSQRVPNPDRFHLNALAYQEGALFIAAEAGGLFRSADLGETWEALESPYEGSFFSLLQYKQQLLALGLRGHLFASEDQGASWSGVNVPTGASFAAGAVSDEAVLLIGSGGVVLFGQSPNDLKVIDESDRRAWSSVVRVQSGWILVGEKGIKRLTDTQLAGEKS